MSKKFTKTIDLTTAYVCDKLYSRKVWQVLFDLFRSTGGDLQNMDNMLCDLYTLERLFSKGSFVQFWHFNNGYTSMQAFNDPEETCYRIEFNADNSDVVIERASKQ